MEDEIFDRKTLSDLVVSNEKNTDAIHKCAD